MQHADTAADIDQQQPEPRDLQLLLQSVRGVNKPNDEGPKEFQSATSPNALSDGSRNPPAGRCRDKEPIMRTTADVISEQVKTTGGQSSPPIRYVFGPQMEYELLVAGTPELKKRAWALVYQRYRRMNYAAPNEDGLWYGLHQALPDATTLLMSRQGKDVATLTLIFDSLLRLPADTLYSREMDDLRSHGRRLCEIISLANAEIQGHVCHEILKHMFKLAYLTARRLEDATDFIITVNPYHVGYYTKKLLFEAAGEERAYDKVGGVPAVLLRLKLDTAEDQYLVRYGDCEGSFYRFFVDRESEPALLEFLAARRPAPDPDFLRAYFEENRPILKQISLFHRQYVYDRYNEPNQNCIAVSIPPIQFAAGFNSGPHPGMARLQPSRHIPSLPAQKRRPPVTRSRPDLNPTQRFADYKPNDHPKAYLEMAFWNIYARVYDNLSKHFLPYQRLVKEITEIMISSCSLASWVLDAGCGTGNFSIALGGAGYRVLGFDLSTEMLKRAKEKTKANEIPVHFQQGSLTERLPYKDNTFDAVININALYMLQDPESTLKEFFRILKQGGKLVLSTPRRQPSIWESVTEIIAVQGAMRGITKICRLFLLGLFNLLITTKIKNGHYFYWQEQKLRNRVEAVGFKINLVKETYTANTNLLVLATKDYCLLKTKGSGL